MTSILQPTLDDLRQLRDEILRIAEQYGASNVRVFGSVARGAMPGQTATLICLSIFRRRLRCTRWLVCGWI